MCIECQQWQQQYGWHLRHYALYEYNEMMKDYMHRYKFLGDYRLRLVFQAELSKLVRARAGDLVVPIPITARAWQERGFNQVTGLLVPGTYQEVLDAKEKDKPAQSSKTRRERLRTPQPFCLPANLDVVGKRVLLVDDVYTTGRTLYHAASLFKQAGCSRVGSVSLAR
ncbi:ComF family protein [Limosilactobacillus caccae]|uniref:ComF family protein n=1 Tax=Limosilactobacillus caccae TaxID=1926284 RepID=UPI001F1881F1|nr:phosphoribosyltransferase family protein [Limosilactobacillus caccae]